jgi:hypothetical protein
MCGMLGTWGQGGGEMQSKPQNGDILFGFPKLGEKKRKKIPKI